MKKILVLVFCFVCVFSAVSAQTETVVFAHRDTCDLRMDIYSPTSEVQNLPCVIYIFGGGFLSGSRDTEKAKSYCTELSKRGFFTVAIDYRLGLKDEEKPVGIFNLQPFENAVKIAVEDIYFATNFLIDNAEKYGIDTSKIILHGTSAGAIAALQADFELCNRNEVSNVLPNEFHYAGIISFSGSIFTRSGRVQYREHAPAPTLFFHGTADKLVNYNQIKFFNIGFFGTNALVKRFEKFDYPYSAIRYEGCGHEIANQMLPNIDVVVDFIQKYVFEKRFLQSDCTIFDPSIDPGEYGSFKPSDLAKMKD